MGAKLPESYIGGGSLFAGITGPLAQIGRMLNNLRIFGDGRVDVTKDHVWLYVDGGAIAFSGTAYVAGVKTTGLTADATKPWVKCDLAAATASEQAGPPSNPFPANEEWFLKSETAGDIHVSRA